MSSLDTFDFKFVVLQCRTSPFSEIPPLVYVYFDSHFIQPCDDVLQDVHEFVRDVTDDSTYELDEELLASEIISCYNQAIQSSSVEISGPRLISLEVYFVVELVVGGGYIPIDYIFKYNNLRQEDRQEPTEINQAIEQSMEQSTEINQAIEQSMEQLSLVPASQEAMESLVKIKLPDEKINVRQCTICLEDFGDVDNVLATPCNHVYHEVCIVKWLETSHMCPLCRYQMR